MGRPKLTHNCAVMLDLTTVGSSRNGQANGIGPSDRVTEST
ncbi:hypothetical protein SAMN03159448_05847 [Sinorhizobium sp. NFACC03]|nr:hypothetical protein SAMN03159448_05847 [Sinorhizobium sp. NFACC03]